MWKKDPFQVGLDSGVSVFVFVVLSHSVKPLCTKVSATFVQIG